MLVDSKWERAAFFPFFEIENCYNFLAQIFYSKAVKRQIIQLHSSLIDYQGNGLMFLGPSGIGKTTQAELWNQYRDALIINGDVVFVQETPDAFLGWGTPWHGSSPYCENTSVPVKALIVLKQAQENSIRELTGFEKFQQRLLSPVAGRRHGTLPGDVESSPFCPARLRTFLPPGRGGCPADRGSGVRRQSVDTDTSEKRSKRGNLIPVFPRLAEGYGSEVLHFRGVT